MRKRPRRQELGTGLLAFVLLMTSAGMVSVGQEDAYRIDLQIDGYLCGY